MAGRQRLSGKIAGRQYNFARDDTTPIPRPSRYYGRRQDPVARDLAPRSESRQCTRTETTVLR